MKLTSILMVLSMCTAALACSSGSSEGDESSDELQGGEQEYRPPADGHLGGRCGSRIECEPGTHCKFQSMPTGGGGFPPGMMGMPISPYGTCTAGAAETPDAGNDAATAEDADAAGEDSDAGEEADAGEETDAGEEDDAESSAPPPGAVGLPLPPSR